VSLADGLRFLMRGLHIGATAVWIGGGLLYLLARSTLRASAGPAWRTFAQAWGVQARRGLGVLVASGVYLLLDRLTDTRLGLAYLGVLAVKLAAVVALAGLLLFRVTPPRGRINSARLLWGLAATAGALGVLLTVLYEGTPHGP